MSASAGSVQSRDALRARVRGLYGIADAQSGGDPGFQIADLLAGGCRLIQLRCKGWSRAATLEAALGARAATRAAGALLVINDWPEIAAEVDADGVHVGQGDVDAAAARAVVGEGRLVGVSHNRPEELAGSLGAADYLAVGPMWSTPHLSRPKPVAGLGLLAAARAMTALPVVAIGGVTPARVAELRAAGADAWAVIGAISGAADRVAATRAFVERG